MSLTLGCVTSAYIPVRSVTGHHTSCQQKIPVLGNVPVRMHRYIGIVDAEVVQLTENLGNSRSECICWPQTNGVNSIQS